MERSKTKGGRIMKFDPNSIIAEDNEVLTKQKSVGFNPNSIASSPDEVKTNVQPKVQEVDMSTKQAPVPEEISNEFEGKSSGYALLRELEGMYNRGVKPTMLQIQKASNALGATVEQVGNYLTNRDSSFFQDQRQRLSDEEQRLDKELDPEDKALMKPSTTGKIGAGVMAGALNTPTKIVGSEFGLGYGEGYSKEGDITEGVRSGLYQAGIASPFSGASPVIEDTFNYAKNLASTLKNGKATTKDAYDFLIKASGETNQAINSFNKEYAKAIGKSIKELTEEDKVMAILNNSEVGSKVKLQAEYYNEFALSAQHNLEESMKQMIKNRTDDGDIELPIVQFREYLKESGDLYGELKDILIKNFNDKIMINPNDIEGLKNTILKSSMTVDDTVVAKRIIKQLEDGVENGISVEDLIPMKSDLNSLNLKSTKAYKAGQIGNFIDSNIKEGVGDEAYELWKEVNKRYSAKKISESENPLGKIFMQSELVGGKTGYSSGNQIAKKLISMNQAGYRTFNDMRQLLGEDAMASVEKGIIKELLKRNKDLGKVVEQLDNYNFSTVEGRNIQAGIDELKGLIPTTDASRLLVKASEQKASNNAWSDNIFSRFKYKFIGKLYNSTMKRLPEGEAERAFTKIGDIMKDAKRYKKIETLTGKALQEAFEEEQKLLKQRIKDLKSNSILTQSEKMAEKNRLLAENAKIEQMKRASRLNIEGTSKPTKPKQTESVTTLESIYGSKGNPNNKPIEPSTNQSLLNMGKDYGGNPTKPKGSTNPAYKDISDSLLGTKKEMPKDNAGSLGMTSSYGGKATGTGGVNTDEAKNTLSRFMDDIANPRVSVNTNNLNELFDSLKAEGTTMNDASVAKEKAWNEAMDIVNLVRNKEEITPIIREQLIKAVKRYYDLIDDNI